MNIIRSLLFMPGNNPGMLVSADVLAADAVIFDLEDAVQPEEKDAARNLVEEALRSLPRARCPVAVRINPLDSPFWRDDLSVILPARPDAVIIPKATPDVLRDADAFCREQTLGLPAVWALLESPEAIVKLAEFFSSGISPEALLLGGEDYAASLGVARTKDSRELWLARTSLVTYAKAYGCLAIDTPFTDIDDTDGLRRHAADARALGFDGVLAIHPSQIEVIRQVYLPARDEIAWAEGVLKAADEAAGKGQGVFSYDGKMVDRPVILRARAIMAAAGSVSDA
ncbi:MAG TPA: CoA ester lyase [Clostridiaceae bacterium]|nr:CoA ester lyase [Clostridiaceae bacterium]